MSRRDLTHKAPTGASGSINEAALGNEDTALAKRRRVTDVCVVGDARIIGCANALDQRPNAQLFRPHHAGLPFGATDRPLAAMPVNDALAW